MTDDEMRNTLRTLLNLWEEAAKLTKVRAERDEAIEQLRQAKAQKLQAVKVLVGVDECCGECQDASENENQRRAGGDDE
jgi:hypothetical protein